MIFEMGLKAENGAIRFTSGRQFTFLGKLKIPVPSLIRGDIELLEWYDDEKQKFYLGLKVTSKLLGLLFGFTGWFDTEYLVFKEPTIPQKFKPTRKESRE